MAAEKIAERITDIQFDWYARLLPGGVAVVFYFYLSGDRPDYAAGVLVACTMVAYLLGHAVQPLSGFCIGWLQRKIDTDDEAARIYREYKQEFGRDHLSSVVLKAHAEATGMFSAAVLLPCVIIFLGKNSALGVSLALYFLLMSFERVRARRYKILDMKKSDGTVGAGSPSLPG